MSKKTMQQSMQQAEKNARVREVKVSQSIDEKKKSLIDQLNELTGDNYGVHRKKGQNNSVPFSQLIYPNLDVMRKHKYITSTEVDLLTSFSKYMEFKTNVLIEVTSKRSKKEKVNQDNNDFSDLAASASISYLARELGEYRQNLSVKMNKLKEKGILATAETGMISENGRVISKRTWLVNPNILYKGSKDEIDLVTQRIFSQSLKYILDENEKTIKLPVRLFL